MQAYHVLEARHVSGHVVWLRFRDGTAGEIDLAPALRGPVFEPLRDPLVFRNFFIHPEFHTLVWPNGADFAPEFLHNNVKVTAERYRSCMPDFTSRRQTFRQLHESGCFVMPNPWDSGSARYLRHLGFQALATTSAGFAFSRGLPDAAWAVSRDSMLGNIADIVAAVDVPVNADFESGYAHEPDGVAHNVRLCAGTGVAGLSIEDLTGDRRNPLYELPLAIERIKAARAAIDASGAGVLLTARTECYLVGHREPLKESVRRLQAFAEAGADVLYAPGLHQREDITTIVTAVRPKPVNILVSRNTGLTVAELAGLGVRRISVGSALSRAAWTGFLRAAETIAREGSFAGFDGVTSHAEINGFFRDDLTDR